MPLVEIEIVRKQRESLSGNLISALANELGEIFNSPAGTTWIKLYELPAGHYAENNVPQEDVYPVFIKIIKSELPENMKLELEVKQITIAVANICDRPEENVHIVYEPEGRGRVSFGGKIVT